MKIKIVEAQRIGNELGVDWDVIPLIEFAKGINVELEHGKRYRETNITKDDLAMTGKIAWAHLKEYPDYYTRLQKMEGEADEFWRKKRFDDFKEIIVKKVLHPFSSSEKLHEKEPVS